MTDPAALSYIQGELAKGLSRDQVTAALVGAGWKSEDVDQAFLSLTPIIESVKKVAHEAPAPAIAVSEKDYPITTLWLFKTPIIILLIEFVALIFGYWYPDLLFVALILLIANPLIRMNFHYQINEHLLWVKQGVFSKKERNLPYGVIQNVLVKQDLFDRVFGLASLTVENAGKGAGLSARDEKAVRSFMLARGDVGATAIDAVGSSGNKVNIPGLTKANAEILKSIVLKKMQENPIDDNQSGL